MEKLSEVPMFAAQYKVINNVSYYERHKQSLMCLIQVEILLNEILATLKISALSSIKVAGPTLLRPSPSPSPSLKLVHLYNGIILLLLPKSFVRVLLALSLTGINKFIYGSKNEMNSDLSSKKISWYKWPILAFLITKAL